MNKETKGLLKEIKRSAKAYELLSLVSEILIEKYDTVEQVIGAIHNRIEKIGSDEG